MNYRYTVVTRGYGRAVNLDMISEGLVRAASPASDASPITRDD